MAREGVAYVVVVVFKDEVPGKGALRHPWRILERIIRVTTLSHTMLIMVFYHLAFSCHHGLHRLPCQL